MSVGDPPEPSDYCEYYLTHLEKIGRAERTVRYAEFSIGLLEDFLEEENIDEEDLSPEDALKFKSELETRDRTEATVKKYLSHVSQMYEYYSNWGVFDGNPISLIMDEIEWDIDQDPSRIEISLAEMRNAVQDTENPLWLAIIVMMLKTGARSGEICNLDLQDIHLNNEKVDALLPEPRTELKNHPDTLYIDAGIKRGDIVNGRKRSESNKRDRSTKIPIDEELEATLVPWLAARQPSICPAKPLFIRLQNVNANDRHDAWSIHNGIKRWAEPLGWYDEEADQRDNVTPHFFRHFFTTHLRRRVDDEEIGGNEAKFFVKGIRGDAGEDVIDTYTQRWGDYVRKAYKNNMYRLFD